MKKVLLVITKSNWGGAQRYVFDLSTSLSKDQYDVAVALGGTGAHDAAQGTLDAKLRAAGVLTIYVSSFMRDVSLWRDWRALRELMHIFKAERPHVVHLNSSKAGGLGALAALLTNVPRIVFTSHGLAWDEDRNPLSRGSILFLSWCTFLMSDVVIVLSQDNYRRVRRLPFCRRKTVLVRNGIKPLEFLPKEAARAKLGGGERPNALWIGSVAELTWNKGLHHLLRAAAILKRRGKEFFICIVGEGEERKFLTTVIEEEGLGAVVTLRGFVQDAHCYLNAFDIFALPSVKEGLPYAVLEAGQAGLPVVASRLPSISDVIGEGVTGLLTAPKNAADLADKLQVLIEDVQLRDTLGHALKARVAQEYSLARMIADIAALY